MKLILIDGGPASGKNTLGNLLVKEFQKQNNKAILLDLDKYVEEFNPSWKWTDKQKQESDQLKARVIFAREINNYLQQNYVVIAIGERFLTKEDMSNFINRLQINYPVFLYHLSTPISLRAQRLHKRGPHSLINLEKDQGDRDLNIKWYGYIYKNTNSEKTDTQNLFQLIQNNQGILELKLFKK